MERLFNWDELKVPGDWSRIWSLRMYVLSYAFVEELLGKPYKSVG